MKLIRVIKKHVSNEETTKQDALLCDAHVGFYTQTQYSASTPNEYRFSCNPNNKGN